MTIIAAIACRNSIVVGADSRTTNEDLTIRDDAIKLHTVFSKDGDAAILAHSGNSDLGPRIAEAFSDEFPNRELKDRRGFADIVQDAVAQVKDTIRRQFHGTATELQKHFEDHRTELVLAHYFQGMPFIFTVNFALGVAKMREENPVCIGCGSPLASFLLDSFNVSQIDGISAMACAMYVIDRVKAFDPRCGGPTKVSAIHQQRDLGAGEMGIKTLTKIQQAVDRAVAGTKEESGKKLDALVNDFILSDLRANGGVG